MTRISKKHVYSTAVLSFATSLASAGAAFSQNAPLSSVRAEIAAPLAGAANTARRNIPRLTLDEALVRAAKEAAEREYRESSSTGVAPLAAVFNGLNKPGLVHFTAAPPDTTGAIGPAHYVEIVNASVGAFSRATLALLPGSTTIDAFTGRSGSCDPQMLYDAGAGRWFYAAIDCTLVPANFALLFGWSKTSDPSNFSAGWCKFFLNTSSTGTNTGLSDYPKLGHSGIHAIIGTNDFSASLSFITARVWLFAKPTNGVTTCTPPTVFFTNPPGGLKNPDGSAMFTPVPANEVDNPALGYITAAHFSGGGAQTKIALTHVGGTATAPTYSNDGEVIVPAFAIPGSVPQPGTTFKLDSSDARLTQSVGRLDAAIGAEAVWTQHTINGAGGRSVDRWYEINTATKALRQSGNIASSTLFIFNGAISPTNAGASAAVVNYNAGSAASLVSIRASSRLATSALNTMPQPTVTLQVSSAADKDFTCSASRPCRWGDYAGATPDLTNSNVVWGSNQFNGPTSENPQWHTQDFALTP